MTLYKAGIITASDSGAQGKRVDESGKLLKQYLENSDIGINVEEYQIVPDDRKKLGSLMEDWVRQGIDLILTTGGTGLSPRDFTPEATEDVIDKQVPGFQEEMRRMSIEKTPHGMLSRGVAGIRNQTLIINFPGSPKAVTECFNTVKPALSHALETLTGQAKNCAQKNNAN
ncbi:MogA/MoaB family molybdenum cofactor biosynthesis protein [Natranaerobius thermophilus]|uniref:Molybdenum cofactor biosynthesis protein B n=1 Tax=Natranaerobius thermophilus (strain ATCC BAA-1301 / DSM 18059 / JW/NM-WN-LF) TaxID=457570 RepID=B2A5V1_NATTJ|nr:MogA/MoaB family molybdenum cofactor biosynthesis protein [Natranaerobius thermophilus]ACB84044.1 molybdenum cofactor synthesis domain protein [Natranaerobius thermophilus JW/NM-WN-LF]